MSDALTFDPVKHVYTMGATRLPSVTQILGIIAKPHLLAWYGRFGTAECNRMRDEAALYGTRCHALAELVALHGVEAFEPTGAEPDLQAFGGVYLSWFNANVKRVLFCEARLVSTVHMVAGSVDLIAELVDGSVAAIDLKTGSSVDDVSALQLAAYGRMALEQHGIQTNRRLIIHAPRKTPGQLDVVEYPAEDEPDAWRLFLCALLLHRKFGGKK